MLLALRAASFDKDWARLYAWRNDPVTVANFFSRQGLVDLKDHITWLREKLAEPATTRIYVAEDGQASVTVGMVRFDRLAHHVECSFIVDPRHRGRGYGSRLTGAMLDLMYSLAASDEAWRLPLRANVKLRNYASLGAFAAAGFRPVAYTEDGEHDEAVVLAPAETAHENRL
jgi:RimJ/RimL family protein N-acetyltransferase